MHLNLRVIPNDIAYVVICILFLYFTAYEPLMKLMLSLGYRKPD